jgi:hypothetical protein
MLIRNSTKMHQVNYNTGKETRQDKSSVRDFVRLANNADRNLMKAKHLANKEATELYNKLTFQKQKQN